ncbi:glucosaminidase domain-containing protein [Planococcus salinus]|uniref:Conjugal transfer protein n=1 Tax=Planococcus salinus TaxID=1848460 RepID=A0A3M8P549_9BACL|nr:glucosaminidase domain-containing protein [Planococcus salinus]RNF38775.1 conjugal transfer protein [Planococcus salinus]
MTSPISSNWFYYTTMASLAKAMPAVTATDSSASAPAGQEEDVSSLFSMLLNSMLQGFDAPGAAPAVAQETQAFAPLMNAPVPVNLQQAAGKETPAGSTDKADLNFKPVQFMKLENTLDGKLSGSAVHFINAGKKYDIDPNLLSAIAIHETGNGSSRAANEKNNVAGMMGKNGLRSYGSVEESIFDMARNLRQNYLDQGKTTVAEIGAKYAPVGAANDPTGLNNHWTTGVSRQLNNLV